MTDKSILLVDDEEIVIGVGRQMLEKLGFAVLTATNGKEALDVYKINQNYIDFVVLDMIMPELSGAETYDRLKAINPEIKVLLSSGYSMNSQAEAILARGCKGFIQKPFNIEQISKKIREILDHTP